MVERARWTTPGTRFGALAVGAVVLVTACSGSEGSGDGDGNGGASAGGGQLVIGMTSDPDTLFP